MLGTSREGITCLFVPVGYFKGVRASRCFWNSTILLDFWASATQSEAVCANAVYQILIYTSILCNKSAFVFCTALSIYAVY